MTRIKYLSVAQIAGIASAVVLLTAAAVGGFSYVSAKSTGKDLEAKIAEAKRASTLAEETLRQELAHALGTEIVTLSDARRAVRLLQRVQRFQPDKGVAFVARTLKRGPAGEQPLTEDAIKNVEGALARFKVAEARNYQAVAQLTGEYQEKLNSGWTGRWLRIAGYPTPPAKKSKG